MKARVGTFTSYEQWKKQYGATPESVQAFREAIGDEVLDKIAKAFEQPTEGKLIWNRN